MKSQVNYTFCAEADPSLSYKLKKGFGNRVTRLTGTWLNNDTAAISFYPSAFNKLAHAIIEEYNHQCDVLGFYEEKEKADKLKRLGYELHMDFEEMEHGTSLVLCYTTPTHVLKHWMDSHYNSGKAEILVKEL
ncbi:hypothetical protein C1N53_02560 [Pontibacter sp. SGAir0037]|nr:hypothetical protein C1N53_02560 [Pontibacter sp. SGAir0037]